MFSLILNILLAVAALLMSLAPIGGETLRKGEPKYLKRLTGRGWLSLVLIVITAAVTIIREIYSDKTHEDERKQLFSNNKQQIVEINNLKKDIQVSNSAISTSESRVVVLLNSLIIKSDELITLQKKNQTQNTSTTPKIALLENDKNRYKEELRIINQRLSTSLEKNSSMQSNGKVIEPSASTAKSQIRIVSDSYHIQKKESFIFYVERLSKGIWQPLYNNEFRMDTSGKWSPYQIYAGTVPRFGLKGEGKVVLQITDNQGGVEKCSIWFEN